MPTPIGLTCSAGDHAPTPTSTLTNTPPLACTQQRGRLLLVLLAFCMLNCSCVAGGTAAAATTATTTRPTTTAAAATAIQASIGTHAASSSDAEKLHRNINQNLITLTTVKSGSSASADSSDANSEEEEPAAAPTAAALTSHSIPLAYPPPGSITATSTLYQQQAETGSSGSRGGSSITSFDSTNGVDDRRDQQQHAQQQQQMHQYAASSGSRIQAKDTADVLHAVPMHKPLHENHLDASHGMANANNNNNNGNGIGDGSSDSVFNTPMYFGTENSTVVTTQIGATAHVPCSVHHIGDGVVSWIRKKDYHLLTVGLTTYSSDERFSATHLKHSEDWTLQIKFVQLRDAGVYECQVSTHPPTSIFLHLSVVEARAEISGPPIRYLTPGSSLRLQCRVVQNTEASEYIFWYHDNRMINYDIDRGINVSTEPDFQSSELTILRTRREHSGNFTCVASNTQPASVLVHIFKGDNPAAMYHGHVGASTKAYQSQLHNILALIAVGYRILHTQVHLKIV